MDSDHAVLEMVKGSMDAGTSGISIGRNVFQHRNPEPMVAALSMIIYKNSSVGNALEILYRNQVKRQWKTAIM